MNFEMDREWIYLTEEMEKGIRMKELEYPFDAEEIMTKRKQLRRRLLEDTCDKRVEKRIAVLGGQTTKNIVNALELFLLNYGIHPYFFESEYNKYYEEAMFPGEKFLTFQPDIIYICTSNRNLSIVPNLQNTSREIEEMITQEYCRYETMWERLHETFKCPIIQNNFEMPVNRLLGNRDAYDIHGTTHYILAMNEKLADYACTHGDFFLCDINYASADYGLLKWSDPYYWYMYKYAVAVPAIPYLAFNLANIIKSVFGRNKKGLVLDLDNTIWGGIVGDDGPENLAMGPEDPRGQAYYEFQKYIKFQQDMGVFLAIDSKNHQENALDGLRHPDCLLKEQDFVAIKANWEPKDVNFIQIAQEVNVLPESMVFLDDNPAERMIVTERIPGVTAPELEDAAHYTTLLSRAGYFEPTYLSEDDVQRSQMLKENAARTEFAVKFSDYGEYLESLEMRAVIKGFVPMYYARIAQLTNKSNQFNLTTKRLTQAQIEAIAGDDAYMTLFGSLQDRFGDNGVVSVMIGRVEDTNCHIELWLMSCRVLKRDMEKAMLDEFVAGCKNRGITRLIGYYYPTAKNKMVSTLYEEMGFEMIEDHEGATVWGLDIDCSYKRKNNRIRVEGAIYE